MNQTLNNTNSILSTRLESLNLLAMLGVYQDLSEKIVKANRGPIDYLEELTRVEVEYRNQKHIDHLLKLAKLPRNKLLLDFDATRCSLQEGTNFLARGVYAFSYKAYRGRVDSKMMSW